MSYPYISAGQDINISPKDDYIQLAQETLRDQFYNSSDWHTIQEEDSFASNVYQNVDVRVNNLVTPTTGDNVEDDFKKILFQELDHSVDLGRMYQFESNYWLTINVDKIKTLSQTIVIRRCNNTLRWLDEETGALYTVPCSITYLIKENRDYSTAGSAIVVPSGMIECFVQNNSKTHKIKPNQRFLFGNSENWTSYRIEGGGINNYNNQQTMNNETANLIRFSMAVDYKNYATDDLVRGIPNFYDNTYVIELNQSSISGDANQTVQLVPTITLNEISVSRTVVWSSSNVSIATVNSSGLVTFVGLGTCTISCKLSDNLAISDTCSATTNSVPVDNYQVIISPVSNYILETMERTWTIYLYKNGTQQSDTFIFTLDSNTIPSSYYVYTPLTGNSFKIKNIKKFLTDVLEVNCVSGIYSKLITVNLRGVY